MVQAAVDVEMSAADATYHKMNELRTGLGFKMRQLDALSSGLGVNMGPAVGAGAGAGASNFPPMHRPGGPSGLGGHSGPPHVSMYPVMHGGNTPYYPAGLGPMSYNDAQLNHANVPYQMAGAASAGAMQAGRPQQQPYWGLEQYYAAQEQQYLDNTQDTRKLFNPFPDLVHQNIYGVSKGISAALDIAMESLKTRLPADKHSRAPPAPRPEPFMSSAVAAKTLADGVQQAAKSVSFDSGVLKPGAASAVLASVGEFNLLDLLCKSQ
jgi:hypothetical protein